MPTDSTVTSATTSDVDALIAQVYPDLKIVARSLRRSHRAGPTLNTTALVNESYMKLRSLANWTDRGHFIQIAARAMRQVLVDDARARLAKKRHALQSDDDVELFGSLNNDEFVVELDAAMDDLEAFSPRCARVVEYRYFAGYSDADICEALGITDRTLRRDWIKAQGWLKLRLAA